MAPSKPMHANVKRLLEEKLPKDTHGHLLLAPEVHALSEPSLFPQRHMAELAADHNLGTLGLELPPFYEVLTWAYRDKTLPVAPDQQTAYFERLIKIIHQGWGEPAALSNSQLIRSAIDHGVTPVCYDARIQFLRPDSIIAGATTLLAELFRKDPGLQERLRHDPKPSETLAAMALAAHPEIPRSRKSVASVRIQMGSAFVGSEIKELLAHEPKYQRWLDNIEAVAFAGEQYGIGQDAINAALLASRCVPSRNHWAQAGLAHVMTPMSDAGGLKVNCQGTLHHHLDREGLNTSTVLFTNRFEWMVSNLLLRRGNEIYTHAKQHGVPRYELPTLADTSRGEIVTPDAADGTLFSLARSAANLKKHYAQRPSPSPFVHGVEYVDRMEQVASHEGFRSALEKASQR